MSRQTYRFLAKIALLGPCAQGCLAAWPYLTYEQVPHIVGGILLGIATMVILLYVWGLRYPGMRSQGGEE